MVKTRFGCLLCMQLVQTKLYMGSIDLRWFNEQGLVPRWLGKSDWFRSGLEWSYMDCLEAIHLNPLQPISYLATSLSSDWLDNLLADLNQLNQCIATHWTLLKKQSPNESDPLFISVWPCLHVAFSPMWEPELGRSRRVFRYAILVETRIPSNLLLNLNLWWIRLPDDLLYKFVFMESGGQYPYNLGLFITCFSLNGLGGIALSTIRLSGYHTSIRFRPVQIKLYNPIWEKFVQRFLVPGTPAPFFQLF